MEGGFQPGKVADKHVVSIPEEVSIGHWRGKLRRGQGRIFIPRIQGQGGAKPVNYRSTINFQTSVDDGAADMGPGLRGREVPLKEDLKKGMGR